MNNFEVSILKGEKTVFTYSDSAKTAKNITEIPIPMVVGDRVKVQVNHKEYLSLAEVQVIGTSVELKQPVPKLANSQVWTNVAPKGKASQSSTGWSGFANRAIDGNTNRRYGARSVTHTAHRDHNPWWKVDLQKDHVIKSVEIHNRQDCCSTRLNGFTMTILDKAGKPVFTYKDTGRADQITTIPVPPNTIGHTVKVSKRGQYLSLAEVKVIGAPMPERKITNLALKGKATQSSVGWSGVP